MDKLLPAEEEDFGSLDFVDPEERKRIDEKKDGKLTKA